MPRIYTSENDPLDFCQECLPAEMEAEEEYGSLGDGPDGRGNCFGYNAEHPCYGDDLIFCHCCGEELDEGDD